MRTVALIGIAVAVGVVAARAPATPATARLQATADEFTLTLSRTALRSGPAIVQLVNLGEDDHDLALRRTPPRGTTRRTAIARPGAVRELVLRLEPGRYVVWCTLADHRARGMSATFRVVRR